MAKFLTRMALQVEVCNSLENYGGLKMIVSHYKTALPRLLGSFAVFLKIILSYAISFCNQLLQSAFVITYCNFQLCNYCTHINYESYDYLGYFDLKS